MKPVWEVTAEATIAGIRRIALLVEADDMALAIEIARKEWSRRGTRVTKVLTSKPASQDDVAVYQAERPRLIAEGFVRDDPVPR